MHFCHLRWEYCATSSGPFFVYVFTLFTFVLSVFFFSNDALTKSNFAISSIGLL